MKKIAAVCLVVAFAAALPLFGGKEEAAEKPAGPEYKIGIVFDVGGRGDKSFNDSAYRGLVRLAEEYGGFIKDDPSKIDQGDRIQLKYLEPKPGGQDREILLRVMAEDGYDLVIGVGFMFTDSITKVAADFPGVHFGIVDGFIPDLTGDSNITCLLFEEHQGSFLVGAIAGYKNKGGKVGFIGGMDMPLIHKFHGGFLAGVMYVNPELRSRDMLFAQYIGKSGQAFNDPKTAENIALNMYGQGATIIYHAAGASGTGLFKAARETGKLAIGVDSDQGLQYATSDNPEEREIAKHILTSMLKRVDRSVFLTGQQLIETGRVAGGYRSFGLADGGVGYAVNEYNRDRLADIRDELENLRQMIIDGEITVPDHDDQLEEWARSNL
ncbi:MAG: BMP family lipoprotein [Spirochaetota bacterium]